MPWVKVSPGGTVALLIGRDRQSPKSSHVSAYSPTKTHDYKQEPEIQPLLGEEIGKNPKKTFCLRSFRGMLLARDATYLSSTQVQQEQLARSVISSIE